MTKHAVIVDLDGTLAEFDHTQVAHWVLGAEKHWDPFFEHMKNAPVIENILRLVTILKQQGQSILICSGRPESHRQHSIDWMQQYNVPFDGVYLRPENADEMPDEEVKKELLQKIHDDGFLPWLVLDDRDAVVAGWRNLGLTCLQCAPGNF
ncbi:MAG: HAD family acid phosphatase [Marinomonas sp.]|uniref:phosphatase domain-containing protein n=1 Tax=Marinomonas sp. GJ51-6 TaxID=2992802 RepID=UPI002934B964|nr:HAD family acid phosphatase [Marinomonas sp. GJ51-6]WOD09020.1 HAD family acid phosphatase [Marinomonas sp. GJ51-6]